jgi:hypothetical protein
LIPLTKSNLKSTILQQNAYQKIIPVLPKYIEQSEKSPVIFNDEEKTRIIQSSITPQNVENEIEKTLDNFYSWLSAKNQSTDLTVSIQPYKEKAKAEITAIYKERYSKLPECSNSDLFLMRLDNSDTFPECRIPSESKYQSKTSTFDEKIISDQDLSSVPNQMNLTIPDKFSSIPQIYKQICLFLMLATILALTFTALIIILPKGAKGKLNTISFLSFFVGIPLILINYFAIGLLQNTAVDSLHFSDSTPQEIKTMVIDLINKIFFDFKNTLFYIGAGFIILGIILLISKLFIKEKNQIFTEI